MKSFRLISLYSGSSGNAFLVQTPEQCILIEAGKSARRLCTALKEQGVDPDNLSAILLTHEHTDHTGALSVFLKHHPTPLHLPRASVKKLDCDPCIAPCLCPHAPMECYAVGDIRVTSFPTPHDSMGSVGYRLEIPLPDAPSFSFGYATDIGHVTEEIQSALTGCRAVVLESNHDPEMLRFGRYPEYLKARVASRRGHLSNGDSALLSAHLSANGTKSFLLAHLSAENNTRELAYDEHFSAIGDESVYIAVAAPDSATPMYIPEEEEAL